MFKRYFNLLKNYNRVCTNYHSTSYKCNERLEKKRNIFLNNRNIQQFNFYSSVANPLSLSANTLENKIVNLCIYLRNGKVLLNDLDETIKIYEEKDYPLTKDASLVLLKCCGELLPNVDIKTRQRLTKRVWNLIENKDCPLTLEHYNTLLALYAQNSELINPQEFLDNMKIKPDESIYCSLLNVTSKMEDYQLVSNVISKFGENLYSWNKKIFNAVIEAHAMQGNIKEAYEIMNKMQSFGIMPSSESYLCLTFGFAKLGDITNIVQIFEKNQPNVEHLMKVVKILSCYGYGKHISSILEFLTIPLKEDKLYIVNNTIIELTYSGHRAEALSIIRNLLMDVEITDACIEYVKCFVSEEIKLNTPDEDILQVIREFMHSKQFPRIINKATEVALAHGRETLALKLFEDMKKSNIPVRSHYYWPLLLGEHKHPEQNKSHFLISHMISLDVEIDEDTLIEYIYPFMDVTDPVTAIRTLIDVGINYHIAITCMSAFLLQNNRIKDVISLCSTFKVKLNFHESCLENSLIKGYKKETDISTYVPLLFQIPYTNNPPFLYIINALLNDAKDFNERQQLIDFLRMLQKQEVELSITEVKLIKERINEIKMDATEIETIYSLLNKMSNKEIDSNFANESANSNFVSILSSHPHPQKMDSEALQNHIIELQSKNMYTRGALKKLLREYCVKNNLKGAEELKQIIFSKNFEWTPGMSAYLFHLYVKKNMLDKAEVELNEIQNNPGYFSLDGNKVLSYAICLVKNNRLKDAFNAINNIKNVNTEMQLENKCFQLLNTIAVSEHYDSTEEMLKTLVKNNYCKITTTVLNPLVQRHLLNNDIESAVNAFLHCVNKYKLTPLKQRIVFNLISDTNSSKPGIKGILKKVLQCISDIHGEDVAIIHLISAMAENGQIKKLQQIFETHIVNMDLLCHHIKFLATKKHDVLSTIFEATANIKEISKTNLCDLIIAIYKANNDYEAATTLLVKMKAADITPSERFIKMFNDLAVNNRNKMQN